MENGLSEAFCIENGMRQGSLLSPFLFRFYVRDLIKITVSSRIGCNIGDTFINLLAYVDDMVILAPSRAALQKLLTIIRTAAAEINMPFNTKKTVVMVFKPTCESKFINRKSEVHQPKIRGLLLKDDIELIHDFQRSACAREMIENAKDCAGES